MNIQRGDVLKARFPHASGGRGKKRPVVVVQADVYNQRLRHAVVAHVTTNLDEKHDPAYLLIEASTAEAKGSGLDRDCLVCCTPLVLDERGPVEGENRQVVGGIDRQTGPVLEGGDGHRLKWKPISRRERANCAVPATKAVPGAQSKLNSALAGIMTGQRRQDLA